MVGLTLKFGTGLSLFEKEKGGIKIGKKEVEGALLGFQYSVVAQVFTRKDVNDNGFIDQFTNLWRGREGVSIRALGAARFMARFVGRQDMYRVLDAEKPWLFREDLVLVVDEACSNRKAEPLHLVSMWVQLHNVPPFNMTEAVASTIEGLIGKVLRVDKDDGINCIGRFFKVKISLDVREPLMRGANVEFPDDGSIWVDFHYEGLPSYCFIYGLMGHVTRRYGDGNGGEEFLEDTTETLYVFQGLDAEFELRGNVFLKRGVMQRGQIGRIGVSSSSNWRTPGASIASWHIQEDVEHERQRRARERVFDDGLNDPRGVLVVGAGMIVLNNTLDDDAGIGGSSEMVQPGNDFDLNIPIVVDQGVNHDDAPERVVMGDKVDGGLLSQDLDPFNIFPIIEVVSRGGVKRTRKIENERMETLGLSYRATKHHRSELAQAEITCEGSLRSQ